MFRRLYFMLCKKASWCCRHILSSVCQGAKTSFKVVVISHKANLLIVVFFQNVNVVLVVGIVECHCKDQVIC